jgi:hypothetical protein
MTLLQLAYPLPLFPTYLLKKQVNGARQQMQPVSKL